MFEKNPGYELKKKMYCLLFEKFLLVKVGVCARLVCVLNG